MCLASLVLRVVVIFADISQRRKSLVGHHYRGAKMALWLDLIPRLHRSDDLDARYHQLDNYADRSSFDEDGTRLPEGAELALLRSLAAARTERSNASVSDPVVDRTTTASGRRRRATTTTPPTASRSELPMSATTVGGSDRRSTVGVMSLAVTVGVGCGLLVVNAAVLTALYCKRGRLSKMRQQLALLAPPGESAQLVDSDRATMPAYIGRRTTDADSPATAGVFDVGVGSSSLLRAPPPPPEPLSPRRRTQPISSWCDPDHVALTSTSTKPDINSFHTNAAILMSETSRAPAGDVINFVTSPSNDTVV